MVKEISKLKDDRKRDASSEKMAQRIGDAFKTRERKDDGVQKSLESEELSRSIGSKFTKGVELQDRQRSKSFEKFQIRSKHNGLERLQCRDIESRFIPSDDTKWSHNQILEFISDVTLSKSESHARVFTVDMKEMLSKSTLNKFEESLRKESPICKEWMNGESNRNELRVGLVDGTLYLWKRDSHPVNLINGYGELFFYFKDKDVLSRYLADANITLGNESSSIPRVNARGLDSVISQLVPESEIKLFDTVQYDRILGKHLQILNDILGKKLQSLEGQISKITKRNGQGGIHEPRFLEGNELENALAKITGIAITDCHLKPNGTLQYYEPDPRRIGIVRSDLQEFGKVKMTSTLIEEKNVYASYIPTPIGLLLQHLGIPSGNKSMQNISLYPEIHSFNHTALCKIIGEIVPQDGTVSRGRISWSHSHALVLGREGKNYDRPDVMGLPEINFIKDYGKKEKKGWRLGLGTINKLKESSHHDLAQFATEFKNCLYRNRNGLIDSGLRIVEQIGVKMEAKPYSTRYHSRTGKVSVAWRAYTIDWIEAMKLAILAPPNDIRKREILRNWMNDRPERVKIAFDNMSKGLPVDKWWIR